jgi:hypothetical protein
MLFSALIDGIGGKLYCRKALVEANLEIEGSAPAHLLATDHWAEEQQQSSCHLRLRSLVDG